MLSLVDGFLHGKSAHHEGLEHVECVDGLIHGNHVASVVDSQELEVLVLLELAGGCAVNEPVLVLGTLEFGLAGPLNSVGPGLTTSPVADKVLIAGVDKHTEASFEDSLHLGSEVVEPVTSEGEVDHLVAFNPVAASHT